MAELRVTYDQEADAAYVYFVDPAQVKVKSAHMYACAPSGVGGMINLDLDAEDR